VRFESRDVGADKFIEFSSFHSEFPRSGKDLSSWEGNTEGEWG
jgi:hypothetical protein